MSKIFKPLLLAALTFTILSSIYFRYDLNKITALNKATVIKKQELIKVQFLSELKQLISDVNFLSHELTISLNDSSLSDFEHTTKNFLNAKSMLYSLRVLDDSGFEMLRYEKKDEILNQIDIDSLQDKSGRNYFVHAKMLAPNEIFISDIDLRMKHGMIEVPYTPSLRIISAVTSNSDSSKSYLIINFNLESLLKNITQELGKYKDQSALVNGNFGFIQGFTPEQDWSFLYRIKNPSVLDTLSKAQLKSIVLNDQASIDVSGYWIHHTTIDINSILFDDVFNQDKIHYNSSNHLKLITSLSNDYFVSETEDDINSYFLYFIVLIVIISILTVFVFIQFLHRRKLNSEIKLKNRQLVKTIDSRDQIYSVISHDLRSPFTGLIGLTDVIVEDGSSLKKEEIIKMVAMVNTSAKSTFNLLDSLLNWTRLEQGSIKAKFQKIEVNSLLDNIKALYHTSFNNKRITCSVACQPDLNVYGDPDMVSTAIRNVLSNAIKYTPEGGTIEISGEKIKNLCRISIKDSGVGITKEILNKIINKDLIRSTQGTNKEFGHGFGLMLCRKFVELNKGVFDIKSEEGDGTEVILWFRVWKDR